MPFYEKNNISNVSVSHMLPKIMSNSSLIFMVRAETIKHRLRFYRVNVHEIFN